MYRSNPYREQYTPQPQPETIKRDTPLRIQAGGISTTASPIGEVGWLHLALDNYYMDGKPAYRELLREEQSPAGGGYRRTPTG